MIYLWCPYRRFSSYSKNGLKRKVIIPMLFNYQNKKNINMFKFGSILAVSILVLVSCNNSSETAQEASVDTSSAIDTMSAVVSEVVNYLPTVQENKVANVHMNKKHHELTKAGKATEMVDVELDFINVPVDVFVASLADSGIVVQNTRPAVKAAPAPKDSVTVTTSATVLNSDQTVLELGKKGQASMMEVVSDPTDPNTIDQIVFTDKKHTDVYNVQAGMSARDVRKLRKDMKHMVKKGKVYMYSDDSNIMYQMTATDALTKDSYTEAEVDDMQVDAIVWKNKKDAKKGLKKATKSKS
jgi:hypothetical protein